MATLDWNLMQRSGAGKRISPADIFSSSGNFYGSSPLRVASAECPFVLIASKQHIPSFDKTTQIIAKRL
ncbi:hypothetical protein N7456_011912 [Penicillium angulare]|uniref:Uncharacterized protein n=1 Tax=Penicillium angulare TaxID=116970 RepID=A0A9W9EUR2_9EURO|nr:hypothetical protein N7456_011912 [Penicillium angulare]